MLVRMWRNWDPLYTVGETVEYTTGPIVENSMEVLQKIKKEITHGSQQSHFWVYIQKNLSQVLKEISTPTFSFWHYSQYPRYGNNPNSH